MTKLEDHDFKNFNLKGPGCVLSAYGIGFNPVAFMKDSQFSKSSVVLIGKMDLPKSFEAALIEKESNITELLQANYLILKISGATDNEIQIKELTDFLDKFKEEILKLSNFPNVSNISLARTLIDGDIDPGLPANLKNVAFSCGINIIM